MTNGRRDPQMNGATLCPKLLVTALIVVAISAVGWVQPSKNAKPANSQSEMKKSFNAATQKVRLPQEVHDALSAFVGKFDIASEVQLAPPPAEPLKAKGVSTNKWIMGGLFVEASSTATADEELKGDRLIVYGYDSQLKKFTMWQVESGSPTAATALGDYDSASKTFTFDGEKDMGPVKKAPVTWVIHVEDDGTLKQVIKVKSPSGPPREFVKVTFTPRSKR